MFNKRVSAKLTLDLKIYKLIRVAILVTLLPINVSTSHAGTISWTISKCQSLIRGLSSQPFSPELHTHYYSHFWSEKFPKTAFPFNFFQSIPDTDQVAALMAWSDYMAGNYELSFLAQIDELKDKNVSFRLRDKNVPNFERHGNKIGIDLPKGAPSTPEEVIARTLFISRTLSEFKLAKEEQTALFLPYFRRDKKYQAKMLQEAALADLRLFSKAHQLEGLFKDNKSAIKSIHTFLGEQKSTPSTPQEASMGPASYLAALFGFDYQVMKRHPFTVEGFLEAKEYFSKTRSGKLEADREQYKNTITSPNILRDLERKTRQRKLGVSRLVGFPTTGIMAAIIGLVGYYGDPLKDFEPYEGDKDPMEFVLDGESEYDLDLAKVQAFLNTSVPANSKDLPRLNQLLNYYKLEAEKPVPNTIQQGFWAAEILIILDKYQN
ncbi:hypothetical protein GW915_09815 [bacterium]|nr:hypothetical protein [bacterium]